jgi:hypothetical protein
MIELDGIKVPERRFYASVDYWSGEGWLREGKGSYLCYYSIPPLQESEVWISPKECLPDIGKHVLLYVCDDAPMGDRLMLSKGIQMARRIQNAHGYYWEVYRNYKYASSRWMVLWVNDVVFRWCYLPNIQGSADG